MFETSCLRHLFWVVCNCCLLKIVHLQQTKPITEHTTPVTVESVIDGARQRGMKETSLQFFQSQLHNANPRKQGIGHESQ